MLATIYAADSQYSHSNYIVRQIIKKANKGGANIRLISLVNKHDTFMKAMVLAKKAVKLHVDAVIGGGDNSEQGMIVSKILNNAKIPLLVSTCSLPDIYKNRPYIFSIYPTNAQMNLPLFNEMVRICLPNPKKIVVIKNLSMQYAIFNSVNIASLFHRRYPGAKIFYINVITGHEDTQNIVKRIMKIKPNIIYMASYSPEVSNLLVGLIRHPFPVRIFVSGASLLTNEAKYYTMILKDIPEIKIYVYSVWTRNLSGPYTAEYLEILYGRYKNIDQDTLTDLRNVLAFDTARYIVKVIEKYGDKRGIAFVKAAKKMSFQGISGKFWFDKNGNTIRDYGQMSFIQ